MESEQHAEPAKLDELELLRWQNASLQVQIAEANRNAIATALGAKYAPGASQISIAADGTVRVV